MQHFEYEAVGEEVARAVVAHLVSRHAITGSTNGSILRVESISLSANRLRAITLAAIISETHRPSTNAPSKSSIERLVA